VVWGVPLAAIAALTALVFPLRDIFGGANLSLLHVLLLFGIGLAFGTGPAIASAVLAFLLTDYFFYEPYATLIIEKKHHVLGLLIFLGIGVSAGLLASVLREHAAEVRREADRTAMLYDLNRALTSDVTLDQVLASIVRGVVEIYGARACRLLVRTPRDEGGFDVVASWPEHHRFTENRQMLHMARHAIETGQVAGLAGGRRRIIRMPHGVAEGAREMAPVAGGLLYVPVGAGDERIGVLEISGRPGGGEFGGDDERMLASFADQAALAVQRARLTDQVTRTRALEQTSELKSALLAAVSHDLRTPLAAIKMSASALQNERVDWTSEARAELLSAIEESTDWLTLVVDNLLDLSRIEGGALRPDRDWHDLEDLLQHVLEQMERQVAQHRVTLAIDPGVPLVYLDYVQISQVIANLVANAVKFSAPGTEIAIAAAPVDGGAAVEIRVTDHGVGIPPASLPHIFETFYRVRSTAGVTGSGVGLAICKGLVEAHGGAIDAESTPGVGTTISVRLPVEPGQGQA
jgi:two-component system sensor histidine kinase KdpD